MAKKDQPFRQVRILTDCQFGLVGEVVEIPMELVAQLKAAALVDDDPEAVAYALEQRKQRSDG